MSIPRSAKDYCVTWVFILRVKKWSAENVLCCLTDVKCGACITMRIGLCGEPIEHEGYERSVVDPNQI